MHFKRSVVAGATAALMIAAALAGPASAYTVISDSGVHGDYSLVDTLVLPAATCGYGPAEPPLNSAWLDWMKVRAPSVFAADKNAGVRDQRRVSWQFKIQRKLFGSPDPWETVAISGIQRRTAWDDQAASFTPMKRSYDATTTAIGSEDEVLRALVLLRWYKPNGAVAGTVKLVPTYYRQKGPFGTATGGGDFCPVRVTEG